ncbi:hypothetical protein [Novosphingobium sp. HII-3]|uniref:DUF7007 domain-containing protein n=1 Tax=Novosphingobium sp. HII-3 TaxID=2075565 RepID=UPI001E2E3924|nr:hypothetical protein [Novosphingobium sp. HII-3]
MKNFAHMPRPQCSEWDAIEEAEEILPGIWSVLTASHGGLILSGERQEAMPDALRIEGGSYEEDVNWSHVVLAFETEFQEHSKLPAAHIALARDCVRCWHPDAFAAFTGEAVTQDESYVLKRRRAYQACIGELCVTAAWGSWADWVPEGKTGVVGSVVRSVDHLGHAKYESARQYALVDAKAYEERTEPASFASLNAELIDCPPGMTR